MGREINESSSSTHQARLCRSGEIDMRGFLRRDLYSMVLSCAVFSYHCISQTPFWEQSNGPYGGNMQAIAITPKGSVLAGAFQGGIYRSTDNGERWQKVYWSRAKFAFGNSVTSIVVGQRGDIFALINGGIYRSTDDGDRWEKSMTGLLYPSVSSIAIGGQSPEIIVCTVGLPHEPAGGVYLSVDNGNRWAQVRPDTGDTSFQSPLMVDPHANIYCPTNHGIARSSDHGRRWTIISNAPRLFMLSNGDLVSWTYEHGSMYRSSDAGDVWNPFSQKTMPGELSISYLFEFRNVLYAVENATNGCLFSTDAGLQWRRLSSELKDKRISAFAGSPRGDMFAATGFGVYRSTDRGKTWESVNQGISNFQVSGLALSGDGTILASTYSNPGIYIGGLYRSTDDGASWSSSDTGMGRYNYYDFAVGKKGELYAATDRGMAMSADNGVSWLPLSSPGPIQEHPKVNSKGHIFITTGGFEIAGGTFRSDDFGVTWKKIDYFVSSNLAENSKGELFSGSFGIFRSTDEGESCINVFEKKIRGGGERWVSAIAVNKHDQIIAATGVYDDSCVVYRSSDNGDHWDAMSTGLPNDIVVSMFTALESGDIYAGTNNGVYRFDSQDSTWHDVNSGLRSTNVSAMIITKKGFLLVGTQGGGIYRSTGRINR